MKTFKIWYILGWIFLIIFLLSALTSEINIISLMISSVCYIICSRYYDEE